MPHFVTIGSPLVLPHVKARIKDERKGYSKKIPVRTPSVVSKDWKHFVDRKNPVALDVHLSDDYGVNRRSVAVIDDLVYNDYVSP